MERNEAPIVTEDLESLLGDHDIGGFGLGDDDEIYPIESQTDGDTIKIWYSNGQVVELTAKWTVMEDKS